MVKEILRKEAEEIQSLILVTLAKEKGTLADIHKSITDNYGRIRRGKRLEVRTKERIFFHLKSLVKEGLVVSEKEEREIQYGLKGPNEEEMVKRKFNAIIYRLPDSGFLNLSRIFLFIWNHKNDLIKEFMRSQWYISGELSVTDSIYDMIKYSRYFYSYPLVDSLLADLTLSEWKDISEGIRNSALSLKERYSKPIMTISESARKIQASLKEAEDKWMREQHDHVPSAIDKEVWKKNDKILFESIRKAKRREENLRKTKSIGERLTADLFDGIIKGIFREEDVPFRRFLLSYYLSLDLGYYSEVLENLIGHFPDSAYMLFDIFSRQEVWDILDNRDSVSQEIRDRNIDDFAHEYWLNKKYELDSLYDYFKRMNIFQGVPSALMDRKYFPALFLFEIMGKADVTSVILEGPYLYSQLLMRNPWQLSEELEAYQEKGSAWFIQPHRPKDL